MSGPISGSNWNSANSWLNQQVQRAHHHLSQARGGAVNEQQEVVANLRQRAETDGDPRLSALADQLEQHYRGREMAPLAADVYNAGGPGAAAPLGWTRASADSEVLAQYQLSPEMLAPSDSGFRAEIYIPDPAVHGDDAVPVVAFKGTDFTSLEDWANNFRQGIGAQADYYDQAMGIARAVNTATGGQVAFTGHSLGGGMAVAASAVTGREAVTFNSAGMHPETAARFLADSGTVAFDTAGLVDAFQVDGDILTSLQEAAPGLSEQGADRLAQLIQFGLRTGDNALVQRAINGVVSSEDLARFEPLLDADGSVLRGLPEAQGTAIPLDALLDDGTARTPLATPLGGEGGLLQRIEGAVSGIVGPIATGRAIGRLPGEVIIELGQATRDGLTLGGAAFNDHVTVRGAERGESITETGRAWAAEVREAGAGIRYQLQENGQAANEAITRVGEDWHAGASAFGSRANSALTDGAGSIRDGAHQRADGIAERSAERAEGLRSVPFIGGGLAALAETGGSIREGMTRAGGEFVGATGDLLGNSADFTVELGGQIVHGTARVVGGGTEMINRGAGALIQGSADLDAATLDRVSGGLGQAVTTGSDWIGNSGELTLRGVGEASALFNTAVGTPLRSVGEFWGTVDGAKVALANTLATFARDPVLRDVEQVGADFGEMVHRHGMDVVSNGIESRIGELERQAGVVLSN